MIIKDREIKFVYSMQAFSDVSEICEDNGCTLEEVEKLFTGKQSLAIKNTARFIAALNKAYEDANDTGDNPLTVTQILALDPEDFIALEKEAMAAYHGDSKTTIKAVPQKKMKSPKKADPSN